MENIEIVHSEELDSKYLTFWLAEQLFGVQIADVVQIISIQPITEVPNYPSYVKGIINLRGSIIPVIDMRLRLVKPEAAYTDQTCVIITSIKDRLCGFVVDQVDEVSDIFQEEISPPPQASKDHVNNFLSGIGKHEGKIILLLDVRTLLNDSQI